MDEVVAAMAVRLAEVRGVRAVVLGGSRARGAHRPDADWDLGVYYRGGVDVAGLARLAGELTGGPVEVAGPGGWGPWVNGGAWLTVEGRRVDWILRDLDRVERVWADCRAGRYEVGVQAGHPLGFWSPAYAGEVALCRVLADPAGEVTALRAETAVYPEPLRAALVGAAWEADFSVAAAAKSAPGGDVLHVGLCLSRAFGVLVQSLHAHHRLWCLNEKGALAAAAALPAAPPDLVGRVATALRDLGPEAVASAADLTAKIRGALASP
ncbi:nucleotidyltransferase domain-containing protein [Streptomyces sp. PKU-MA01144]|uniref:nucleotidyltransferase family protein n=1 Tax=Streptomyces sp. PKU-MA01144 TaxID=2729138 RepID=UPI00148029B9|nr:nucleotidyltransferase domain-containing protein [Streptomyces sp. PKU-MA01144]NNJ05793.1 nucleotidyltransferase domain-containing protein [Streptomyces sp. PKU-MA01144]